MKALSNSGPSTVSCGTPNKTSAVAALTPSRTFLVAEK